MDLKLFLVFYFSLVYCEEWSYYDQTSWGRIYDTCAGSRQSPININTRYLMENPNLRLYLEDYERPHHNLIIHNNGHRADITLNPRDKNIVIGFGRNPVPYVFYNLHFHWGRDNFKGSEHSVDNMFGSAEKRRDGILVLSVILSLSRENTSLRPIIQSLPKVIQYNTSAFIEYLNLGKLLPRNKQWFSKYSGSSTTPPCSESATMVVFEEPTTISGIQLSQFRRLLQSNGETIVFNTRNTQPLKGRIVEVSVPDYSRRLSYYRKKHHAKLNNKAIKASLN